MNRLIHAPKNAQAWLKKHELWDSRVLVLLVITLIAFNVFWSGAAIVQQNYDLSLKAEQIRQENEVLMLENRNKELQNQFYATDEYADITARRVNGVAAKGEKVYIIPKEEALATLITEDKETPVEEVLPEKPQYQKNLEAWINLYFGG